MTRLLEMSAVARVLAVLALLAVGVTGSSAYGQATPSDRFEGRPLEDALARLQQQGLRIIYSSQSVRPDMRVRSEPTGSTPRARLESLLVPHGLMVREGPGDTLLVVRNPRNRAKRESTPSAAPIQAPGPPPLTVPTTEAVETLRFEASVDVAEPVTPDGGAPLVVRPLEVAALAGGFENLFRAMQALPGVVGTEELGSRISVRGGSPDQNLTIMDGVEIHNPFRLTVAADDLAMLGLASTFNAETIDRVALYPGAFDVRYGDRLSSLLVVAHREGTDTDAVRGSAFVGLADANLVVEGRLPHGSGSWLVSARRTYLDLVPERVLRTTVPAFGDVHARAQWRPRPHHRLSLVGVTSREHSRSAVAVAADAGQSTQASNTLVSLTHDLGFGARATARTVVSGSWLADRLGAFERSFDNSRGANTLESITNGGLFDFQFSRDVRVRDVAIREDVGVALSRAHLVDAGAEVHGLDTRWAWQIAGARSLQQANASSMRLGVGLPEALDSTIRSVRMGAWLQDRWQLTPHLVLQPGLRVDRSRLTGRASWSPRLSATLAVGSAWRVDGAARVHTQTPGYEKTLYSDYFLDLSRRPEDLRSERALHAVGGVQRLLPAGLSLRVDAYYKRFSDLVVGRLERDDERIARLATYDVPAPLWPAVSAGPQVTVVPTNGGGGLARGVEVLATRSGTRHVPLSGWASYSFSRADRQAYGVRAPFDYDRRHAFSAVATVRLGPRVDLSVTGRVASGLPRTRVRGVQLTLVPDVTDVDRDGNRTEQVPQRDASGSPLFQPDLGSIADINRARQPGFRRVDTRLTYRPKWAGERWTLHLDFINVLNTANISQVDSALVLNPAGEQPGIVEVPGDRGIPFFPSFGVRVWF